MLICLQGRQLFFAAETVALQGKIAVPLAQNLLALHKRAKIDGRHALGTGHDGRTQGNERAQDRGVALSHFHAPQDQSHAAARSYNRCG